jgi:hypothetical protein
LDNLFQAPNVVRNAILDGGQISLVAVCGQLDAVGETAFEIVHKVIGRPCIACPDVLAGNQLCSSGVTLLSYSV